MLFCVPYPISSMLPSNELCQITSMLKLITQSINAHGCLNKITTSSRVVKFSNRFLLIFGEWWFYIKLVLQYFENHRSGSHIFAYCTTLVYTPWQDLENRHNKYTCGEVRNSQSTQHGHSMQTLLLCLVQILSFLPCCCQ
jgi:hypothetical protein